jgi:heme-degrading monooxygenase HmoA
MFIVANRVPVAKGWEESFEERFRQRAGQIDKQPGFVSMQILKPQSDDTPYAVLTTWQDKAAFDTWVGSDDFKLAHSNPMPKEAFDGESKSWCQNP